MSVDLHGAGVLAWRTASGEDRQLLDHLQANIVKGHTRDYLAVFFLRFGEAAGGRAFVAALAPLVKSAWAHLQEVGAFHDAGTPGSTYVGFGLTYPGYEALEVPMSHRPDDPCFVAGMRSSDIAERLGDRIEDYEEAYLAQSHAIVVVGDSSDTKARPVLNEVRHLIGAFPGVSVVTEELGIAQHNEHGHGIEHFGYVDGRSQPLFLAEDVDAERRTGGGVDVWNPALALDRILVPDPTAAEPRVCFGSYFIFRKLEQNVREFKLQEAALAERLGLHGEDAERAGAMIVGRFEDGTPVVSQHAPGANHPVPNDFVYASDAAGSKCPRFGHIRKMNPRGSTGDEAEERRHLMARRGQTYGIRFDNLNDGQIDNKPTGGVGLLFMAFNADIGEQFEFTQAVLANDPARPQSPARSSAAGVDLVIAQGPRPPLITVPVRWAEEDAGNFSETETLAQTVTMRGGDYFFMPSLATLGSLGADQGAGPRGSH